MSWQAFIGVFLFGFVTIATPGPANLALMAAGAGAGVKRGVPFLAGIWGGGFAVLVAMGAGLGVLLASVPDLYRALQVAGICYIIYLAVRIVRAGAPGADETAEPPSFWAGLLVHPLNPKIYAMTMTGFTAFLTPGAAYGPQAFATGAVLMGLMLLCTSAWLALGEGLSALMAGARRGFYLRLVLAGAMVVSVLLPLFSSPAGF